MAQQQYVKRHLEAEIQAALGDTRVVVIAGPRQAGKSTVTDQATLHIPSRSLLTLDDRTTRDAATADPLGFVSARQTTMVIDEVQRVPDLGDAIKQLVDQDQRPGQFVLTGSARIETIPKLAEPLVGRMEFVTLYPFSQGEVLGVRETFADRLFSAGPDPSFMTTTTRAEYIGLAVRGGYPEIVRRPAGRRRSRWFQSYVTLLAERDLQALGDLDRLSDIPSFLRLVAARTTAPVNFTNLARDASADAKTAKRWLERLAQIYVVKTVPAWSNNRTTRASRAPTLYLVDSGLGAYLLGVNDASFVQPTMDPGALMENFVVMELAKQLGWSQTEIRQFHYRTRDGEEVDCVLEAMDRRVFGIEVKSAMTAGSRDFSGLRSLGKAAADNFVGGAVLYTGRRTLSFGNKMWAIPIGALWS